MPREVVTTRRDEHQRGERDAEDQVDEQGPGDRVGEAGEVEDGVSRHGQRHSGDRGQRGDQREGSGPTAESCGQAAAEEG